MHRYNYTIKINKNNWKEPLLGLIFIFPYIEFFIGGTWRIGDEAVGRAIIVAELILILLNFFRIIAFQKKMRNQYKVEFLFFVYILIMLIFNSDIDIDNVSTALWMISPLLCAITIHIRIINANIDYRKVARYGTWFFSIYAIMLVLYNLIYLSLLSPGNRLTALAGGPVIFGYTLAVYFAFVITNKNYFLNKEILFFKMLFTIIAILTGSRGGVWPIIVLWMLDFVRSRFSIKRLLFISILIVAFIIIDPVEYISQFMPRLFDSTGSGRLESNYGAIRAYGSYNFLELIIGSGPGECFPYQAWVNRNIAIGDSFGNSNGFVFNGFIMLVQPHNTILYFLLELGVIGVFLFIVIIYKNIKLQDSNLINRVILIGTIFLVNLLDSIFIIEPGVALIMWIMILFSSYQTNKSI